MRIEAVNIIDDIIKKAELLAEMMLGCQCMTKYCDKCKRDEVIIQCYSCRATERLIECRDIMTVALVKMGKL